jgi:hypothetical protein
MNNTRGNVLISDQFNNHVIEVNPENHRAVWLRLLLCAGERVGLLFSELKKPIARIDLSPLPSRCAQKAAFSSSLVQTCCSSITRP